MDNLKAAFISLALECQALKFGSFTLKSGRVSPYFFNMGLFYQAHAIRQLGQLYAKTLLHHSLEFQHLFGAAYKGIPLVTSTAVALAELKVEVTITYNRKEAKDHGEGGELVGAPLTGKTIFIDDVITAGTAFRHSQQLIQSHGGELAGVVIALDRCERGQGKQSALAEIQAQGIPVISIINLFDLIEFLEQSGEEEQVKRLLSYQYQYQYGYA